MIMKLGWLLSTVSDAHFTGKKSNKILVSQKKSIKTKKQLFELQLGII